MQVRCPFADWRPLGTQTEPRIGKPRVFIIHTMVGYLDSVEDMFRSGGYSGTESTFGVGGPWDGAALNGAIWQWQRLDFAADAQYDGNAYATSVETSDGGQYLRRWADRQAESIVRLGVWWCQETGNPARLVRSPNERGFGYHRQFDVWNRSNHACPGDTRQRQYIREIIPEIRRRLEEDDMPLSDNDIERIVKALHHRHDEYPYGIGVTYAGEQKRVSLNNVHANNETGIDTAVRVSRQTLAVAREIAKRSGVEVDEAALAEVLLPGLLEALDPQAIAAAVAQALPQYKLVPVD